MQRLARIALQQENQKAIDLFNQFKEIKRLLARHLPPSTLQLFAEPVVKGDIVEWYSDLEGQPMKLSDKQQDTNLRRKVEDKLTSIRNLIFELQNKNAIPADKAQAVRDLLEAANYSQKEIYSINNEPVLVGWGIGQPPAPPPVIESAVVAQSFFAKHRLCCWLLPLLLLLLLGLLAWWFYLREAEPVQPIEPVKLEDPLKRETLNGLPEWLAPKPEEPPKQEEPPKVEEPKPEEVKAEVKPKEEKSKEEKPKEEKQKPAYCTKTITPAKRPQMVMVFDNSISMLYSLLETEASLEKYYRREDLGLVTEAEQAYIKREPRRLTVAKSSASAIVDKIDPNIDIGLVTLNACPGATNSGFFSPGKRSALKSRIRSMYPDENHPIGGTPLYSGLKQAAAMLDGVNRDAFILLISDGEDNCRQGNVCTLAKQLASSKPKLKINVVDIGNAKAANCAANATGGRVFTANSKAQVSSMINQAIKPMVEKEECK